MENIGDRIKQKRKELGLTQVELGKKLNISDRAVSKWEQGEGDPNLSIIPDIANVLGVSLNYLLLGKEDEPAITLDDMDVEKRLSLLIRNDDVANFKKYEYQSSEYVFGRSFEYKNCSNLKELNCKIWLEIINKRAEKIFNLCCDELIKKNTEKVWAAFLVYDFIDEFIKMVVDVDRPDVLETIGFRFFAIGDKFSNQREFEYSYDVSRYGPFNGTYFIANETFEYLFTNREKSPKCFEYATTFEFQIESLNNYYKSKQYTFTHLQDHIVDLSIKFKYFDILDKILESYNAELNNDIFPENEYYYYDSMSSRVRWKKTYVFYNNNQIIGRIIYFKKDAIESLLNAKEIEYVKKLNDYNGEVIKKVKKLKYNNSGQLDSVWYLNEQELDREIKLRDDLSGEEKTYLICLNKKILVQSEIKKLRDLKLVRDILDKGYYNYYEFAYEMLVNENEQELLKFLIDNDLEELATKLLMGTEKYSDMLSSVWSEFNLKPGYVGLKNYDDMKKLINIQNPIHINNYNQFTFDGKIYDVSSEYKKLVDNKLIAYIKSLKEEIYNSICKDIDEENKDKQEAIDRAKAVKGLTKDYFEGLLVKNGLFSKKEQKLFILDLCSLFDAILKFDYHCDGKDFYERMTNYFDNGPKSRATDDEWVYEDKKYEIEVVKPWNVKRELFNRLRIQRNNIAHSESKKVIELSKDELCECLDFVFSINKEDKEDE